MVYMYILVCSSSLWCGVVWCVRWPVS